MTAGHQLADVLRDTCAQLGLNAAGARLLRFTNNAVYALRDDPVVVRIVGAQTLRHRAYKVVRVAEYFAQHGVPAIRLLDGVRQPLEVDGHLVTVWQRVPMVKSRATPDELAELLRAVHALPVPAGVGRWHPLADVRARIAGAQRLDRRDADFLLARCAEVEQELAQLRWALPTALVHGDAHPGNVIPGPAGPVLCDFDSACVGPPEWDLVPMAVGVRRFGDPPGRYRRLADRYGFDVTAWSGFSALRAARELKLTTSVLPVLRSNPSVRGELHRRLADLRAGRENASWSRFP